ncbi:thiamine phosphate synthase [Yoonia sediminilitoris]|uniref:Thiamine-phosphate pyrophosphorylase n=1 Tax=Yoonia sediminilitoris TaxID=1286148 RepID=A0A2T6KCR0_9RHOB|nr:thiamine phosphate synthase [Yoonia sediminilitoris]PUB12710.1 thiamine-phosphate pyrophosphorylase [Yoonia sediminilitoris]RCW94189.1 thiamine-phosphate pyrophosphorylase [Yoonia sediminilitoris]
MTDAPEHPQIYLITPSEFDLSTYPAQLAECLDQTDVACVRLALSTKDDSRIAKAADALREVTHARDVALVIDSHVLMVERLGLDGVHLNDGARSVAKVRKDLGDDAIVGSFCGNSRHDGMTAGELGVDYVSFGPVGQTALGDGRRAGQELFEWWSLMIEVPVVAEGALDAELIRALAPHTDFFGIGDEIWAESDPASALRTLYQAMLG